MPLVGMWCKKVPRTPASNTKWHWLSQTAKFYLDFDFLASGSVLGFKLSGSALDSGTCTLRPRHCVTPPIITLPQASTPRASPFNFHLAQEFGIRRLSILQALDSAHNKSKTNRSDTTFQLQTTLSGKTGMSS